MRALALIPLLFTIFTSLTLAASPTSFCKCTCGTNSTIIPLDGPLSSQHPPSSFLVPRLDDRKGWPVAETPNAAEDPAPSSKTASPQESKAPGNEQGGDRKEYRAGNCNDCNRQFCLEYMNLPICKGKGAEEIFTTCFQRDSRKDEAVVYIFIVATAGLLLWAAVKPWVGRWVESARERRSYIPVANEGDT